MLLDRYFVALHVGLCCSPCGPPFIELVKNSSSQIWSETGIRLALYYEKFFQLSNQHHRTEIPPKIKCRKLTMCQAPSRPLDLYIRLTWVVDQWKQGWEMCALIFQWSRLIPTVGSFSNVTLAIEWHTKCLKNKSQPPMIILHRSIACETCYWLCDGAQRNPLQSSLCMLQ